MKQTALSMANPSGLLNRLCNRAEHFNMQEQSTTGHKTTRQEMIGVDEDRSRKSVLRRKTFHHDGMLAIGVD